MKLKENKGMSLIVFTIILAVLVVVAGGVIVYLLNNPKVVEKTTTGEQNNLVNNESILNKNDNEIETGKEENSNNEKEDVEKKEYNITRETIEGDTEKAAYAYVYTRKDNNKVIWTYKTEYGEAWQWGTVEEIADTNERIYIYENGTIKVLSKENGKILWENKDYEFVGAPSVFADKEQNLYIFGGSTLDIIDSKGKIVSKINHKAPIITDGVNFEFVNDKELLIEGTLGRIVIDLSNYSIKYAIIREYTEEDTLILRKTDGKDTTIWKHEDKGNSLGDVSIINGKTYIVGEGKATALDIETGKVIWKNSDYKGEYDPDYCFDSTGNLYLYDDDNFKLYVIDKNGKTVKVIDNFGVSIERGPTIGEEFRLRNNETELVIPCKVKNSGYAVLIINLKDYSIKVENVDFP